MSGMNSDDDKKTKNCGLFSHKVQSQKNHWNLQAGSREPCEVIQENLVGQFANGQPLALIKSHSGLLDGFMTRTSTT